MRGDVTIFVWGHALSSYVTKTLKIKQLIGISLDLKNLMNSMLVISYLFFCGIGSGTFLVNAILSFNSPIEAVSRSLHRFIYTGESYKRMIGPGFVAGSVTLGLGFIFFIFNVAQAADVIILNTNDKRFELVMIAMVLVALFCLSTFLASVWMGAIRPNAVLIRVATGIGVLLSFIVSANMSLFINSIASFEYWNPAFITLLFTIASLSAGSALVYILSHFSRPGKSFDLLLRNLMSFNTLLVIVEIIVLGIFVLVSTNNSQTPEVITKLIFGDHSILFWVGLIAVGLLLPAILNLVFQWGNAKKFEIVPSFLVIAGDLLLKICVVMGA